MVRCFPKDITALSYDKTLKGTELNITAEAVGQPILEVSAKGKVLPALPSMDPGKSEGLVRMWPQPV